MKSHAKDRSKTNAAAISDDGKKHKKKKPMMPQKDKKAKGY